MKKTLLFCTLLGSLFSFQFAFAMMQGSNNPKYSYQVRLTLNGRTSSRANNTGYTLYSACQGAKLYHAVRPVYIPLGADNTRCDAYIVSGGRHYCNVVVDKSTIVKSPTQTNNWINQCSLKIRDTYSSSEGKYDRRATINVNTK